MKKLMIVIMFLSSIVLQGQTAKENLRYTFDTYINLTMAQEFDKSFDYIIQDLFEIIPRAQMVALMKQIYNNPKMEIHLENPKILSLGAIEKFKGKWYAILTYSNIMRIKVNPEDTDESAEDKAVRMGLLKVSFNKKFGTKNVKYNEETGFFEINVVKSVCCASEDGKSDWKFLTLDKAQQKLTKSFLPAEIFEKL